MISIDTIRDAAAALKGSIRYTDLIYSSSICPEENIYLKTENLQVTGSFKVRGSAYKISRLTEEEKARGLIACSAGNHAQGVALAATRNGIRSLICMPDSAPISKVEATKRYGAEVELVPGGYDDAAARAQELCREHGYTFVHPFNDEAVIAGQGTIGLEILEQLPEVDSVVVPIGGGGLISGVAVAIKSLKPSCKVYGVQAAGVPSMYNSIRDGKLEALSSGTTIADGIAVKRPGDLTFALCQQYVDEIVTVTDDEVASAILSLIERQKMIAEGAGAVSVAAVRSGKIPVAGKNTVCVISGGNIDVTILSRVITRGLVQSGRFADITVELSDKPGQLSGVTAIVAREGGNIISALHDRNARETSINACYLRMTLETRDFEHIQQIRDAIEAGGYRLRP